MFWVKISVVHNVSLK